MTLTLRKSDARGKADHGWLKTRFSFSFADYYDPRHMQYRSLRVMNEDRIGPGGGFPMHPHRDMEIITVVLDGELEHRDSLGSGSVIRRDRVQRMTAGRGIVHSEFNPSEQHGTHLYQIWLMPQRAGLEPSYEEKDFDPSRWHNQLGLVAAPDGHDLGALHINQDARLYQARLDAGHAVTHELVAGRGAWVQVLDGELTVNDTPLAAGDGAAIESVSELKLKAGAVPTGLLLFDLA